MGRDHLEFWLKAYSSRALYLYRRESSFHHMWWVKEVTAMGVATGEAGAAGAKKKKRSIESSW